MSIARNFKQKITAQASGIVGAHTDIPLLITRTEFKDSVVDPTGLENAQSDGGDLIFTSDEAGLNRLSLDVVKFEHDSVLGAGDADIQLRVKVSSFSTSTPDVWCWFNSDVSESQPAVTDPYGRNSVWTTEKRVYHSEEDPSGTPPQVIDSSGNVDGTTNGTMTPSDLISAKISNGYTMDGVDDRINCGDLGLTSATVSMWINPTVVATVAGFRIYSQSSGLTSQAGAIGLGGDSISLQSGGLFVWDGSAFQRLLNNGTIPALTWGKLDVVYSSGIAEAFFNGVSGGHTPSTNFDFNGVNFGWCELFTGLFGARFFGNIDELIISSSIRSANWIQTAYNNENSPSTFWVASDPIPVPPPVPPSPPVTPSSLDIDFFRIFQHLLPRGRAWKL